MNGIGHDYRRTQLNRPKPVTKGLDAFSDYLIGLYRRRGKRLRELRKLAGRAEALRRKLTDDSDGRFQERIQEAREQVRRRVDPDTPLLIESLALSCEAMRRAKGWTPHDVQIVGALALGHGFLAEMATGEGKTLTVALWTTVAAWGGQPVHVVTSNDYLARRDAEIMEDFYRATRVTVSYVIGGMEPEERKDAYAADVVYTTSKELLADFLKDRIELGGLANPDRRLVKRLSGSAASIPGANLLQRGLHTAVVDEADNVLIDEAVIPLRISRKYRNEPLVDAYTQASEIAGHLERETDYLCDQDIREVSLTPSGWSKIQRHRKRLPALWRGEERSRELVEQTLVAREFFQRDKDYVVREDKVTIVDGFSGRLMPDRSWSQGLHQAIEAKEGVELSDPTETLASLSFQRFFRFFRRLSGLSGTAGEAASEFWQIYRLPLVQIPTFKPCIRRHLPDSLFADKASKWAALLKEIRRLHERGIPVLVGTNHVADSEYLARAMDDAGLPYRLLNAVRSDDEAAIVAQAGQLGSITIATNMAGRGTDIGLGEGVAQLGGLHVLASERNESRRIDRQLFGRAGRHGDPGLSRAYLSLEDELPSGSGLRFLLKPLRSALRRLPWVAVYPAHWVYLLAQKQAEASAFFMRKQVIENDTKTEAAISFAGPGL